MLLAVLAGVWFVSMLGLRPLSNPDEGRYAEIPREMAASGDFVTPRLDGVKYFEKPPLLFWLSAVTFRVAGVSEFTARLWNALFAVGGVLATYAAARVLYDRLAGWCAAIVLATSLLYHGLSQVVLLDMGAAVTMACALFAFLSGVRRAPGRARRLLFMAFYVAMALATLAKGLIGIALPGAVVFLWAWLLNRWRTLWPFYPVSGVILFLVIAAPWHVLAARDNGDFLHFYFIHEHLLRFTTRIHNRVEPWWFFLVVLAAGMMPWAGFAFQAMRRVFATRWANRHAHADEWFLVIWVVFVVVFFSISQSKLVPYILPVWPPLAVLTGRFLGLAWRQGSARDLRAGAILYALLALSGAAVLACAVVPRIASGESWWVWRSWLVTALVGGGGATLWCLWRDRPRGVLLAMAAGTAVLLAAFNPLAGQLDKRSTKQLADVLKPMLGPDDRIYCVGFYPQDLPVYLGRLLDVVDYEGELAYGIRAESDLGGRRFLRDDAFAGQWEKPGRAYAIVPRSNYARSLAKSGLAHQIVAQTSDFLVLRNRLFSPAP